MMRTATRRVFLTVASAAAAGVLFLTKSWNRKAAPHTATFLTREGKLVEVPVDKVPLHRVAITKEKLVSWIWRHQRL